MFKSIRMYLLVVILCCTAAFSQTMYVNGATNPSGIPDENAYTSVFREMSATQTTTADKVALIGFTSSNDVSEFQTEMTAFGSESVSAQTGADLVTLGNRFEGQVRNALTPDGWAQLQTFVNNKKSNMALWSYDGSGSCNFGTMTTLFDVFYQNFGTDSSDYELYGDGYDTGTCPCHMYPGSVSIYNNGTYTYGVYTKAGMVVTKIIPNSATAPYVGTGVITTEVFTYVFYNGCRGTAHISYG